MALVVGWLKDKVFETGNDPCGRWVHTEIRGKGGRILTLVCTHQVCQNDRKNIRELGESTFAKQQMSMFMEEDRRDPRRLRCHHRRNLVKFVQECQNAGKLVSVRGDFNEVLGVEDANGLARLCTACGLGDIIIAAKHGHTDFDIHIRGSKVLDNFLIPPELEDAVLACGHEPHNISTMGDHRAFHADFDTAKLLGGKPTFANLKASRDINSKKCHKIPICFKHWIKHLEKHKFFKQLEELQKCINTDTPNHQLAQKLDHRFQRSAKHAGKKCPQNPRAPCSPKIAKMRNVCQLLRQAITQHQRSHDMTKAIQATRDQAGSTDHELPLTLQDCEDACKQKRKELIEAEKEEIKDGKLQKEHQEELIASCLDEGNKEHANPNGYEALTILIYPYHPGHAENGILIKHHPPQGKHSLEHHFRRCEFYHYGQECYLGTNHNWEDPIHMIRFLNSCQNLGVLCTLCNQERHVPAMQCKFVRERIVAMLKECMASPSFALLGGRNAVVSTATSNRSTPNNNTAVSSLITRPAASHARCHFRSSSGGTGGGSGAQSSGNTGRSPRDRNVQAIEASAETPSFDDASSLEPADDFIVAKLNGECLGGYNVDHPPCECPNVVGDVAQQKKTFASLSSKQLSLPIRAVAATEDGDDDEVDLIDLHDPKDQDSDADQDLP